MPVTILIDDEIEQFRTILRDLLHPRMAHPISRSI